MELKIKDICIESFQKNMKTFHMDFSFFLDILIDYSYNLWIFFVKKPIA